MDSLPYAIVAFLDFLGFRQMIEEDSGPNSPKHLPLILDALSQIDERVEQSDLTVTQFSDSIVLTSKFEPREFGSLLTAIVDLQRLLLERSIVIRGGVAFGQHYAQSGRLFSKALVSAYVLESRHANAPRILIDSNLLDWVLHHEQCDTDLAKSISDYLLVDRDQEVFVNYLTKDLMDSHASLIHRTLSEAAGDSGILAKAHWMVDYHEFSAGQFECDGLRDEISARFRTL